ncbi:unnamed protein product, partial [Larinioides sclopetarius]
MQPDPATLLQTVPCGQMKVRASRGHSPCMCNISTNVVSECSKDPMERSGFQ